MQTSPARSSTRAGRLTVARLESVEFIVESVAPEVQGDILFLGQGTESAYMGGNELIGTLALSRIGAMTPVGNSFPKGHDGKFAA
jgi:hypothetical protein